MIWIILNLILLPALALSFQPEGAHVRCYWIGLAIKVVCSIAFGMIYMSYLQSGDTIVFHKAAIKLHQLSEQSFGAYFHELFQAHYPVYKSEWRNEFFAKLLSIPYVATQGNYWLSALYLMLFNYLCMWYLISSIQRHYQSLFLPAFIAFMVFPSPIFWSSGVLKDTLINGSVCYLVGICIRYYHDSKFTFSQVVLAVSCLLILFYLKFYLVALMGLIMSILAWSKIAQVLIKTKLAKGILTIIVILSCAFLVTLANRNINLSHLPKSLFNNYSQISEKSTPDEILHLQLAPTYLSILQNTPKAFMAGLFRPFIWEVEGPKLWFGIENFLLMLLAGINLFYFKQSRPNLLVWLAILFIASLAVALPMASPNFGSLMRYKAVFIPFFTFLLLINPYRVIILKEH